MLSARKPRQASVNGEPQPMLFAPEYADDVPGVLGSARVASGFSGAVLPPHPVSRMATYLQCVLYTLPFAS